MEHRFVMIETWSQPEIYKVPLHRTAKFVNDYSDRKVEVFETLKEATAAALAVIERAEANSRPRISPFSTGSLPAYEALRRRLSELTEDRVETLIP